MTRGERRCPICKAPVAGRAGNGAWPFCSDRCRLQDLGRWMGEAYRIPAERPGDGELVAGDGEGEESS
jgi:endogenous inhibitor of DNA gyrase (YacG/DUF329 family)